MPAPTRTAALVQLAQQAAADGATVVVATPAGPDRVAASLRRRGLDAQPADAWPSQPGIHVLLLDVAEGASLPGLLLLPIGPLLRTPATGGAAAASAALADADALRLGDLVMHEDHGVARLSALRDVDGEERVALEFAEGAELLVPAWDLDRLWRLGGDRAPARLGGDAWQRRRAEVETEVQANARALAAAAAAARVAARAPAIPPHPGTAALARRFPHPLTPCQRAAIEAAAADMDSGRPMDRLVCGDVGFGKTEVALRATAQAALAGWQVLLAAPTTVLARQHLEGIQRRFAGTGIEVAGLIRGGATPEGRAARRTIASGAVRVVVGTHGLASEGVRSHKLGLAVIDEEQRFGDDDKRRLAGLAGTGGDRPHLLTMTATPIPRTLQGALVGLRDVSLLTTPPAHRQPTRTFVLPWNPVVVREALLREQRRGGQSFLVVPRISDLQAMQTELAKLVPGLQVVPVHGRMRPKAQDAAMVGFGGGNGDVLLATDIIEAGLDIPRANLMVVMGADRFGLSQLHQLRGRVGRGARRGAAYFLTERGRRLAPSTLRRLRALETLSGLGDGAAGPGGHGGARRRRPVRRAAGRACRRGRHRAVSAPAHPGRRRPARRAATTAAAPGARRPGRPHPGRRGAGSQPAPAPAAPPGPAARRRRTERLRRGAARPLRPPGPTASGAAIPGPAARAVPHGRRCRRRPRPASRSADPGRPCRIGCSGGSPGCRGAGRTRRAVLVRTRPSRASRAAGSDPGGLTPPSPQGAPPWRSRSQKHCAGGPLATPDVHLAKACFLEG